MAEAWPGVTVVVFEAVSGGGMGPGELPASWLAEGAAIRRTLAREFAAVPGVRVVEPVDARSPAAAEAAPPGVSRIVVDPARPVNLADLARRADAALVVAPETGGMLAGLARELAGAGITSLGSTPGAIALCGDKLRLAEHFGRLGIPTPPTRTCRFDRGVLACESPPGRVVVKPVDGAGGVDSFVLNPVTSPFGNYRELWAHPGLLLQPYRPGPALSASFLIGRDGCATCLAVGRQRITLGPRGEIRYEGGEVPVSTGGIDLAPVAAAVAAVPGLLGLVGVDFVAVEPTGAVEVIEINPRVTTAIVGLARLAPAGTIARAWLDRLGLVADNGSLAALAALGSAPPVRFRADGTIPSIWEQPR